MFFDFDWSSNDKLRQFFRGQKSISVNMLILWKIEFLRLRKRLLQGRIKHRNI